MPLGCGEVTGIIPKLPNSQRPILIPQMGFRDSLVVIFSYHSWQATRERKKPMPLPQPKGIKTILPKDQSMKFS
jgi:hypothetical protein